MYFRGVPWTGAGSLGADKHAKDSAFLANYAKERWEVGGRSVHRLYFFQVYEF